MEKNYIKWFYKEFGQYWNIWLSINLEQLNKLPVDSYWSVKLILTKRKELGKYWETHTLYEDTYKKEETKETPKDDPDLPF